MQYIHFSAPPFPFFVTSGDAIYRPGDRHRKRAGIGFFDLILVETGTLFMEVLGARYAVEQGGLLLIPANSPHLGTRNCEERTVFHWLHFDTTSPVVLNDAPVPARRRSTSTLTVNNHDLDGNFTLPIFQQTEPQQFRTVLSLMEQLESISINKFTQSIGTLGEGMGSFEQQAIFFQLLSAILPASEHTRVNGLAQSVMQYIQLHYNERLTLDSIAESLKYHPTHIIRCMKQQYGATPAQIVLKYRLQKACNLLDTSALDVFEIADLCGFSSSAYFCRVFRSRLGMTPQSYRFRTKSPQTPLSGPADPSEHGEYAE